MVAEKTIDTSLSSPPDLGARIKSLRLERGLSLAQLAAQTPLSEGTLSRIENGHSDISAQNLYPLARAFDVDISAFFEAPTLAVKEGVRSLTRAGKGLAFRSDSLAAQILAADISAKKMFPFLNVATARSLAQAGGLHSHPGEEFLMVLSGRLIFHCAHYTPLLLEPGDSLYFEASSGHAYVDGRAPEVEEPTQFLVVTTDSQT